MFAIFGQQDGRALQQLVVVVDPGAQLAAQPAVEKHLLQPCIEIVAPAQVEEIEQWQQQLFAQRDGRIQGHGLVELLVEGALRQRCDGFDQLELPGLPVAFRWRAGRLVEQLAYLADGGAALQPGQDRLDAFDLLQRIQAMALGGTLGLEQAVAALPGAQGDGIDAGAASQFADGQQDFRRHCASPGARDAAAGRPAAADTDRGACANGA